MLNKSWIRVIGLLAGVLLSSCASDAPNQVKFGENTTTKFVAINAFMAVKGEPKLWYIDNQRQSLAVDAVKFKDLFAKVETPFQGQSGIYNVQLTALTETDGESQYQVFINNKALALMTNPETTTDYAPHQHQWQNVTIKTGDKITVAFNSVTNGKIPEGDITAYSRGRWTQLSLQCVSQCN